MKNEMFETIIKTLKTVFRHPSYFIIILNKMGLPILNDRAYIDISFKIKLGRKPDLDNPQTFNEKLQWLKLNDRDSSYTTMVDKYEVKGYVANILGEKYIIPTIGVYDRFEEIDFDSLPDQFVMKCTHDSGGLVIVRDKAKLNINKARRKINKSLKRNYYYPGREWPYKNVKPRIIIEKYMVDDKSKELKDYKYFCFNGKPEIILTCSERFSKDGLRETWFDSEWNLLPITEGGHEIDESIKRPKKFKEMSRLAKKLSNGIAFVRIDFYEIDGKVYFGEITFFPASGFERFDPGEWDKKLGEMIDLSVLMKKQRNGSKDEKD